MPLEGRGLGERNEYLLDMIQGSLNEYFNKYSSITLINRRELDLILDEQGIQLSGSFSDDDIISIGKMTGYHYILTGWLAAAGREFVLNLTVTNTQTAVVTVPYQKSQLTINAIRTGAIGEASLTLLEGMGVILTDTGRGMLEAEAQASAETQSKLARRRVAERSGNHIAGLVYAYGAVERDASLTEAEEQLRMTTNAMSTGSLGLDIQNDVAYRRSWLDQLRSYETYFRDYHPFDIVLSNIQEKGLPDYANETQDFEFIIGLQPSPELIVMQKVLNLLIKDLNKPKRRKQWGFSEWPNKFIEYDLYNQRKFTVVAGLFDENDEIIARVSVDLLSQLLCKNNRIYFDSTQRMPVTFSKVNINDLTSDMQVRLISINNGITTMDALDAEDDGYWTIRQVETRRFPRGKRATISQKERTITQPQAAAQQSQSSQTASSGKASDSQRPERQPKQERKAPSAPSLKNRIGASFGLLINPGKDADENKSEDLAFSASVDIGFGSFAIEGFFNWPINKEAYGPNEDEPVFGMGGGIGYTTLLYNIVSTLSLGANYNLLGQNKNVITPYAQWKIDFLPWKAWLGVRIGVMAEMGNKDWGDGYEEYFKWAVVPSEDGEMMWNIKLIAGLVFWL
jgi:hypothetical protein